MTRFHVMTNAESGETTEVLFTPEEEAAADAAMQREILPPDPVEELADFLRSHPEVAALLSQK